MRKFLAILGILLFSAVLAWTHSGRTDKKGGHYNRKTGEYHYHNSGVASANVDEVEILKAQVSTLSAEVQRLRIQVKDLFVITERLKIPIVDVDEGHYYYAKTYDDKYRMLPSEIPHASLYYELRHARLPTYSKEKMREMGDTLMKTPRNHLLNPFRKSFVIPKEDVGYHPDMEKYISTLPAVMHDPDME